MNGDPDPVNKPPGPVNDDPLTDVLRRALERPPELVPGMSRAPYRRGDVARNQLRRKYRR